MRFCPFCAQENPDDSRECVHCGKRLPAARTPPPKPAAPPREKPAPKVAPRAAPRSLPITSGQPAATARPAENAGAQLAVDPPTTQMVMPPERPSPVPAEASLPPPQASLPPPPQVKVSPTGTVLGLQSADSERRNTLPLAVKAEEMAAPRDDLPTEPNPKVDAEELAPSDDGKAVAEPAPPTRDDSLTLPKPRKAVVTKLESARRPEKPAEKNDAPDEKASIIHQPSPSSEPAPPVLDPTPHLPTQALPAMPAGPMPPNIFGSVKYLVPLGRAIVARKRAQRSIRRLLHDDQHLLDKVLKELGKAAREHELDTPAIADEMRKVKAEEQRRARAEADTAKADDDKGREDARWNGDEAERKSDIGKREGELKETENELRKTGEERRGHEAERARLEGQIRAAEKRSSQAMAQAQKAEATPPEKGGGPNTAANLRLQAQEAQKEATGLIAPRDEARAKAEALDAPIHTLTQKIVDARSTLAEKRKELADAAAQHKKTLAALQADKERAARERSEAEREMSQRFVSVGTMLNLHRVEDPAYKDLYQRIDELKSGLNAREATIVRLESELRTYDRRAAQTGLIAVGIVFFVLVLLSILLAVILSR
jgi:hypothetical protein